MGDNDGLLPFEREQSAVLVRREVETDPKFGSAPEERSTEQLLQYGIVNINKPSGPTSHQVSAYVQKILGLKKSGHSGTLDPKVTGVLPIAFGEGTKVVQALLTAGKEYICLMHLHHDVDEETIRSVCASFIGKIKQMPPVKSAVKRQWRYRKIYYLQVLEIDGKDVLIKVGCQAGTYIRKLVHDIGQKLKVGAHMQQLRRTKAAGFGEDTLCTLQELTDAYHYYQKGNDTYLRKIVMPLEKGVDHLLKVWVLDSCVDSLAHGAQLKVPGVARVSDHMQVDDPVAIMTLKNELVAFGRSKMTSREMVNGERGIAVRLERVFMHRGVYPKVEKAVEKVEEKVSETTGNQ